MTKNTLRIEIKKTPKKKFQGTVPTANVTKKNQLKTTLAIRFTLFSQKNKF